MVHRRFAGAAWPAPQFVVHGHRSARDRRTRHVDLVHEATDRGFELLHRHGQSSPSGIIPCISFDAYDEPRAAANAATAYLSLGNREKVLAFTRAAERSVELSESDWSRALTRIDVATALVTGKKPDVERAASLGIDALS